MDQLAAYAQQHNISPARIIVRVYARRLSLVRRREVTLYFNNLVIVVSTITSVEGAIEVAAEKMMAFINREEN